jgi:hypothetical protein
MGYGLWAVALLQSTIQTGEHALNPENLSGQTLE